MKNTIKTIIDIVMGAVIPIIILNRFSGPEYLGPVAAYVVAAMVPVAWVFIDLFFITRKFNFITSYVGISSIVSGLLAFWFVDGLLFAIKDTIGLLLRVLLFGGSVLIARPILKYFFIQALNPDTPEKQQALDGLFGERSVDRSFVTATWIVVIETALAAAANFYLNLRMVLAPFGTEVFNQQVAAVNAITRVALTVPSMIAFGIAMWIMYRAVYQHLPSEDGKSQLESDFWDLVEMREAQTGVQVLD
ncbi:MAG TPA: VC0807 family protein [Roseiflexaceae bacterium]|nr:VC0807 family protein [Roseiflexaceae bacterium]